MQAIINTEFTPFSVVTSDGAETGSYIEQQLKRFGSIDDVYSEEFSHCEVQVNFNTQRRN